ncbi:MAG TPA: hypothetical protein VK994_08400 [Bacteroidales bacterium]|nr:hypothetical protein [Bacteroidales bacterium]
MKKNQMTQTILLMLLMLIGSAAWAEDYQKSFAKTYDVSADAQVIIANQYGNVAVEPWDNSQVDIKVTVNVKKMSEKDAQALLDKIDVVFSGNSNQVKAVTKINGKLNCRNCEFSIDYVVKMPASNKLDISNEFGNAVVGNLSGSVTTNISYGNLNLGRLENKENKIGLKFGNMDVDYIKAASLSMEYGALEIGSAGYLDLYIRFTSSEIGEISELVLDGQYESIEIGSVNMMRANTGFMSIEIGELFEKLELTTSYGGLEIDRVAEGFSSIDVSSEFGGVEMGISSAASYSLKAENEYGDIGFPESRAEIKKISDKSFRKEVEAFVGKDKASTSMVIIKAKNSNIQID